MRDTYWSELTTPHVSQAFRTQRLAHSSSLNTFENNEKTNGQFYSVTQADKTIEFVPLK